MIFVFVLCFILFLCLSLLLRPLILSISTYAWLLVLVLLLRVFVGSPLKIFFCYLLFLYLPMMCINFHAQHMTQQE
uniref:Probable protein E5 n=1 Tax=Human papillomavirus 33 TaxID=10586 RepID=F8S3T1_HPV33|nr:early protein E5 [human papillomavirus 33]